MSLVVSALIVILVDQALKYLAFNLLHNTTVVPGLLRFTCVTNRGVAFGIGKQIESTAFGKYLFIFLSLAIVVALLALFRRYYKTRFWARISLGLIVGGAIGNLIDRFAFGHVRDFVDFSFWWTFNPADLAICAGVVVLIAGIISEETGKKSVLAGRQPQENPPSEPGS